MRIVEQNAFEQKTFCDNCRIELRYTKEDQKTVIADAAIRGFEYLPIGEKIQQIYVVCPRCNRRIILSTR